MPRKKTYFYSYTEAKKIIEALGNKSKQDYNASRQHHPRLPAAPDSFYAGAGWENWYTFFGNAKRIVYSTYFEARSAALALGIRYKTDYIAHYKDDPSLPRNPDTTYAGKGWTNWPQFLGRQKRGVFTTYAKAKAAVQALGIKTMSDYRARYNNHPKLPSNPHLTYASSGWIDWYDFLGKEQSPFFATYAEAQSIIQSLGIKTRKAYLRTFRQYPGLHYQPNKFYANIGWTNWYDFLGKDKSPFYATYAEAQLAAQAMGIENSIDYQRNYRNDPKLPRHPSSVYANVGWTNWYQFFCKEKRFASYAEAQAAAKTLKVESISDYQARYKERPGLPSNPDKAYAGAGWCSWYDFLEIKKANLYTTYEDAQVAVRSLGIKSAQDYRERFSQDPRLPSQPFDYYRNTGWTDWYKFLGKEKQTLYATYSEAQLAAKILCIKSMRDYKARHKLDEKLPANPHKYYVVAGWIDWYDFLGVVRATVYATYTEAQAAARALGITGCDEYYARYRRDPLLRRHPEVVYALSGWESWYAFLGNEKRDLYPSYNEAQTAAQAMRFANRDDYQRRYFEHPRLPSNPNQSYAGTGWTDWHDFLGKEKGPFYATYSDAQSAVQELGITNVVDYRTRYRDDPMLPINPQLFYADAGWVDWYSFLGKEKRDFYPGYAEAEFASQAMGLKTIHEYQKYYRLDPMLPANPSRVYADTGWIDWYTFLGKKKHAIYPTYGEAQSATRALDIKDGKDYSACFREDPRLPASPASQYAKYGWTDWYEFLGKEKPSLYANYTEAQTAAAALGVKSTSDYRRQRRNDEKLPADPLQFYAELGWRGWSDFLGIEQRSFYATYIEAQTAAQTLGAKSQKEYQKRYRVDSKLPSNPDVIYSQIGWTGYSDFLGTKKPLEISPEYPKIWSDVERWLDNETNLTKKIFALKLFLHGYLNPQGVPDDPKHIMLRENPFNVEAYQQFIEAQADSTKRSTHSAITAFFKWVLNEYCTDVTSDERNILPIYRNPFESVLAGYADSLQFYRPNESTKAVLGYEFILRARRFLVPNGEQALQSRPTLKDLAHLQIFFDSDWMEIDESRIDYADPNCVWRLIKGVFRLVDGERQKTDIYQIWSPVRFLAIYTLLRLPLRGQQILWLDSGEADDEVAVLDAESTNVRWENNSGSLAGKGSKKRRPQGVIQRGYKNSPNLYVTTNKTGRRDGGYDVEWIPDELVYWFVLLRNWQAKYNTLKEPTPWLSLKERLKTNKKILKARGTQCFLFRVDSSGRPLGTHTAFESSLPTLLYKIQREGENLAVENDKISGPRYITPYTPHSLRVSLITAFIVDGEAPIHLMSKLVGHTSLVMTIYYTKLNGEQMRRTMGETEKRAAQITTERNCEKVRIQGLRPIQSALIATDGNRSLIENDVSNSACVVFDWGICPMSAAACHMGGELLHERKRQKMYGSVEAGYLGQKNCLRCRFFITGIPFLAGLVALANEIALEIHIESGRFQNYAATVVTLEREYYDACQAHAIDLKQSQRKQAIANEQQSGGKLDSLLTDYAAINHYVQSCLKLIKDKNETAESCEKIRLIITGELQEIGVAIDESRTQYHLLAEICQNATIYQSSNPSRALPLISQAIDRMAENNNLAPAMFRLTDEQKLIVVNELNTLLIERLGSWERIEDLFSGELMLLDIDAHEPKLTRISTEIQTLLLHAASHSLNHELKCHE